MHQYAGAENGIVVDHYFASELGAVAYDATVADKGVGVRALAEKFGISLSDVMAIGDNYNDLPILTVVGHPYIMENAVDELKDRFPNKCRRVEDTLAAL